MFCARPRVEQWLQNERAVGDRGVRESQLRAVADDTVGEQQIKIEAPITPKTCPASACGLFEVLAALQQFLDRQLSVEHDHAVQKPVLGRTTAERRTPVPARPSHESRSWEAAQLADSLLERAAAVAEARPESDGDSQYTLGSEVGCAGSDSVAT